ncbi:hypothetical protein [Neobacillus thermocopriae]|uniref:Uncharacterized protein n=1 Tax=Neobacillus thermocopriae TaxID=1215031 RepID=A0A6B3TTR0_9BACI|nr:hypothetical protein [Neobacillus thermocopriae]MED3625334.1 hypothetical protein [Neobacillus thermocopriae]MED3715604.1 hypothetical protein [Neobacillus thermocopriae]NEX80082.1 hypothetical protein [Neobacillus thermocopriae]
MVSRNLKWVAGGLEAFLGIPILGGFFIILWNWAPLAIMLVLHIITLIYSNKEGKVKTGPILGIVSSVVGLIPIVGWFLHIITAIFLLIEAGNNK